MDRQSPVQLFAEWRAKPPLLRRYWIEFDATGLPPQAAWQRVAARGCGVTAYSAEDALTLVARRVFVGGKLPPVVRVREDADLSTLPEPWEWQRHLGERGYPWDIGVPVWWGVWHPFCGYEERGRPRWRP